MELLLFGALLLSQSGTAGKQYAMKKCGELAPGPFNSICINLVRSALCLVVSLFIWLIAEGTGTNALGVGIGIVAGVGTSINLFTWILCSRYISLTLIEGVSTIGTLIIPMFLAPYLFNGETVSTLQWIGTVLVFISVFLFSNKTAKKEKTVADKKKVVAGTLLLILCASGAMLANISKKFYAFHVTAKGQGGAQIYTLLNFCSVLGVFLLLFAVYYQLERRRLQKTVAEGEPVHVELPYRRVWLFILIAAVSLYTYELFAAYAAQLPAAVYYPISRAIAILGSFLLDVIVFKDKVTPKKLVGLVLLIAAVIMINI